MELKKFVSIIRFFWDNISLIHNTTPALSIVSGHIQNNADGSLHPKNAKP
jgi:hypothetical protein